MTKRAGSSDDDAIGRQIASALERAPLADRLAAFAAADPAACARSLIEDSTLEPADVKRALGILAGSLPGAAPGLCGALVERFAPSCAPGDVARLLAATPVEAWSASLAEVLDSVIARAPLHAPLLRLRVALAVYRRERAVLDACLDRIVVAEPSWATAAYAAKSRKLLPRPEQRAAARVALLSSYTIDPLAPFLESEIHRLGVWPELYLAPFDTWPREVMDPSAKLRSFDARLVILAVALDDLVPELSGVLREEELHSAGESAVARVLDAATQLTAWSDATLVVHGFWSAFGSPSTPADARLGATRAEWIAELNAALARGLRALPRAYLFDVASHFVQHGGGDDPKLRHMASMRLPASALPSLARAMAGYLAPSLGLTRKCVVVDLDNTLWGGVVGEDGPSGIRLGKTAPGSEFVEFQRFLKSLGERGILLAVNSKNNLDDAMEVLRSHESMWLRESDFSALRINWKPKPENMSSIAAELNIGTDSLVFVDDNPDERERMRQMLPEVLTVDLPADPARYRATLESLPELQVLAITAEDRARVSSYRAERERGEVRRGAASVEEYLASLDIAVALERVSERSAQRVAQLFQRTNQFNVTTRRYDLAEVKKLASDPGVSFLALHAQDRFGDHGLVAVALARIGAGEWRIDSLLMSCRVIGYGIETALLSAIAEPAALAGAKRLVGEFIPTRKNAPARDLYERHGLVQTGSVDGVEQWECPLPSDRMKLPSWITRKT